MAEETQRVLDLIDKEAAARLLTDLVNISSPTGEEGEIGKYLAGRFESAGLKTTLQEPDQDRYNAVGVLEGDGSGLSLMFNGHLDTSFTGREKTGLKGGYGLLPTVSSGSKAVVEDGRIYGLGATNMKGGVAAFTLAAEAIKKSGARLRGDLTVAGVVGEIIMAPVDEYKEAKLRGYTRGTHYLVTHGFGADMAVVAEPTGSVVRLGHFGPQWVKISTYGVTANTVYSGEVRSPIDRMLKIIRALKDWTPVYEEKIYQRYPHMKTKPVVRISAINGGTPWRLARPAGICSLYVDIRTKQAPAELKREIVQMLNRLKEDAKRGDPEFDFEVEFYLTQPGAEVAPDHPLVASIRTAHKAVYREDAENVYGAIDSDASVLTHFGIAAINYGPRPRDASTRPGGREHPDIENALTRPKVFALLALDVCNRLAP